MTFSITPIDFDSGLLSRKVGSVQLLSPCSPALEKEIISVAAGEGYTFLSIKSGGPLEMRNFYFVGELVTLSTGIGGLMERLSRFPDRFQPVPLDIRDFDDFEALLHNTQKTRFSKDPMIPEELVRRHKFKMLATYQSRCPELSRGIYAEDQKLASLLTCYVSSSTLSLYEIIVDRKYLQAIMAIQLIKSIAEAAVRLYPDLATAQTSVYRDNVASLSFFTGLGFEPTSISHYYHYWIPESINGLLPEEQS